MEELKAKVDGLKVWDHIQEAAKIGQSAIDPELVPLFKWYGIYAQKPKEDGYYMMRIKIPGGQLSAEQLVVLESIANDFADGILDITTRQAIQVHWLRVENFPEILDRLASVGMDSYGGCGDIGRNITGNPLAGLHPEELFDATPELIAFDKALTRNPDFSNLPRKFKISISGCHLWSSQPDINCLSLVAVKHPETAELGYALKVGGGLSTKPMVAKNFPFFIQREQAVDVALAVTTVYRDHGFRDKRAKARLKFLVDDWGTAKFADAVEEVLGYKLDRVPVIHTMKTGAEEYYPSPKTSHSDHLGVIKLVNGNYALGIAFISGRMQKSEADKVIKLAAKYCPGEGNIRTTNKQNLLLVNIAADQIEAATKEAQELGLKVEHSAFTRLGVACTGTEYCNLAIVETKARAKQLFDYLDAEFPGLQEQVMISVTGCPNNCAQYAVADVGLVGGKITDENKNKVDAFRLFLGGRLGDEAQFGQPLKKRFRHDAIHETLKVLFAYYLNNKQEAEEFRHFVDRVGVETVEEQLASCN